MTTLDELARVLAVNLTAWQKTVAAGLLGLDMNADLDQLDGYQGRRCGWYPHRPPRRRR